MPLGKSSIKPAGTGSVIPATIALKSWNGQDSAEANGRIPGRLIMHGRLGPVLGSAALTKKERGLAVGGSDGKMRIAYYKLLLLLIQNIPKNIRE